ncbi:unnamed protein product [Heligmosomoides polygyrus]|uniref:Transposase n=1 Tax=Heligmosomoides polygyrus TaxID=6339 RepID=A0A183FQ96_HELPZ|nr:unnamed protein product [Heligmosomoides polygyrus]
MYLGSVIASNGKLIVELNLRSKIYRAVEQPVAMYGAECWPAIKEAETRLSVIETKMLRCTAGVKSMDRIRNDAFGRSSMSRQ